MSWVINKYYYGVQIVENHFYGQNALPMVNEKPTNASTTQCIGTQYSPTCFGILKFHHQRVKHDPAETGAQYRGKQKYGSCILLQAA
jgi:hypothetical protein